MTPCLVCRVGTRLCALPIEQVAETMRPLPIEPVAGALAPVRGVAIIRGEPVPVLDAGLALATTASDPTRFVTVRSGRRVVALAVDAVIGIRSISPRAFGELPPLLSEANADLVEAMGTLDTELIVLLRTARLVPEHTWGVLEKSGAPN